MFAAFFNKADGRRLASQIGGNAGFKSTVNGGNGNQFSFHAGGEDAGLLVATGTSQRTATQRGIDVDIAVGNNFGTGADHGGHNQIAAFGVITLA